MCSALRSTWERHKVVFAIRVVVIESCTVCTSSLDMLGIHVDRTVTKASSAACIVLDMR